MSPRTAKRVHFSRTSELQLVGRIDETEAGAVWYSHQEYKAMKMANLKAVLKAQKHQKKNNSLDADADVTGIEMFLSPSTIKNVQAIKTQCCDAILDEQERQEQSGLHDEMRLASISAYYSKSSARRAHAIGLIQSR